MVRTFGTIAKFTTPIAEILLGFWYSPCVFVILAGGGVLLVEAVLFENRRGPIIAQLFSLNMLVQAEGREHPPSDYNRMLTHAGFTNIQVCRTGKSYDAILAVR